MACCGGNISSDMRATVTEVPATKNATGPGYSIQGYEDLKYTYSFVDNVFDQNKEDLAAYYTKWGRVLCVLDENLNELYGPAIKACKFLFLALCPFLLNNILTASIFSCDNAPLQTSAHTTSSPRSTSSRVVSCTRPWTPCSALSTPWTSSA